MFEKVTFSGMVRYLDFECIVLFIKMFPPVIRVQRCVYFSNPTTFIQSTGIWNIFRLRRNEIFLSVLANFMASTQVKSWELSANRLHHCILHIYYLLEYGITFLSSYFVESTATMWGGVEPPTNRASVSSIALKLWAGVMPSTRF